jgi:hypothetical protein
MKILIYLFSICFLIVVIQTIYKFTRNKIKGYDNVIKKIDIYFTEHFPKEKGHVIHFRGDEGEFQIYAVASNSKEYCKGTHNMTYLKFYIQDQKIEEITINQTDKYWLTPGK